MNKHCKSLSVWGNNNKQQRQQQRFSSSLSAVLKNPPLARSEPQDKQHVTGIQSRRSPFDPRFWLFDQDERGHLDRHGLQHDWERRPCSSNALWVVRDFDFIHSFYPPDICDGAGLSSSLEKVFFGTFHARMYLNRWADYSKSSYQLLPIITNYHHTQRSVWDQLRHGHVRPDEEGAVGQQGRLRGLRLLPRRGLLLCTGCSSRILMTMMRTAMTTMSNVMAMEASLWQQIPCHQSEMWSEGIATTNARKEEISRKLHSYPPI